MPNHLLIFWQSIDGWIRWACLGLAAPILAVGLLYWGYCWHWWGRDSLLLQYLFQCRCPSASEATRYPNFTLLISACDDTFIHNMSPSGRFLITQTQHPSPHMHQMNPLTGETQRLPLDPTTINRVYQLDDHRILLRLSSRTGYVVFDRRDRTHTSIPWGYLEEHDIHTHTLLEQAAEVLVVDQEALALAKDYQHDVDANIVVLHDRPSGRAGLSDRLTTMKIRHQMVPPPYQTGAIRNARYSPDGRFYALRDGIYHATTNEQLINTELPFFDRLGEFSPIGWVVGQRGVVYANGAPYLLDNRHDLLFSFTRFPVPQPKLLLELPEEFWAGQEEP